LRQTFSPLARIECLGRTVDYGKAASLRVNGDDVFTLRDFVVQLRQQQLPQL
jgi:hypothetical protein